MNKIISAGKIYSCLNVRVDYDLKERAKLAGINFTKLMDTAIRKELERIESQKKEE